MSLNKTVLLGVRLSFCGPSFIIFNNPYCRNQPAYITKVNVNFFYNGSNSLISTQNQLIPERYDVFLRNHATNQLSFNNYSTGSKSELVKKNVKQKKKKKSLKDKLVHEMKHYYHGFRLLFINTKIAWKLTLKRMRGYPLSRREHKLLKRTAGDLFRLLPFSIFLIVPFMELLLPLYLKIFPGMLPTTFQTKKDIAAKAKKSFKVRLKMTKFLQETLDDMKPLVLSDDSSELAKDFKEFFQKVRTTGHIPTSQEILKYSKLFEDEITLDKLPRAQIIALCRYLNLPAVGTTRFLRYELKSKIRIIQIDDRIIQKEGIQSMRLIELKEACKTRGMRFYGISEDRLREQLQHWLDLSVVKKIPPSLLLLSQAFAMTKQLPDEKALAATISSLPSEVETATTAAVSEHEGRLDYETEIRLLKDELLKISEENVETQADLQKKMEGFMIDPETEDDEEKLRYEIMKKKMYEDISIEELTVLEDAMANNLYIEKDCLAELKNDLENYEERVKELREVMLSMKQSDILVEGLAAKRLHKKLRIITKRLEEALETLDRKDAEALEDPSLEDYKTKRPGTVKIEELIDILRNKRLIENLPIKAESQIGYILNKLDSEKDGFVKIRKVSKLLEILNREESSTDLQSVEEYIKRINKEEKLENIKRSENNYRGFPM